MQYETVTLEAMTIAGLSVRTSNASPDMQASIGGLWQRLYGENLLDTLPNRVGTAAYGLYTNYESDAGGFYDMIAGGRVKSLAVLPPAMTGITVPAGPYAKFTLVTDMQGTDIGDAWGAIWALPLPRAYTVDFEEYLPTGDPQKSLVNLYISLTE